ncbi:interleukin 17a/f1 [Tachysurus ichikawai]
MALKTTLLTLPYVMMMVMLMMVTQAAPQKGKMTAHHKAPSSEDASPKLFIVGDLEQEIKLASHSIRPIHNDSISPWEIRYTYDSNRIPSYLPEAHCLLSGCLNQNGDEMLELESRRIFWQVLVLQRVRRGDDKSYYFRLEHKTISVGCTCVRPYVEQI